MALTDELKRRKMEAHGLRDEADLLAFDAICDILHRQWLYESVAPGYGDRRMAVRHLGDVIRRAMNRTRESSPMSNETAAAPPVPSAEAQKVWQPYPEMVVRGVRRKYNKIGRVLHGVQCDLAVTLLLAMITDLIEQSGHPEIWDGIAKGAIAKRDGHFSLEGLGFGRRMQ